jgi:tetratricopeptide (TPR) repeat protein
MPSRRFSMAESTTAGDALSLVQDGRIALMAGDTYTARQHFRQALELSPESVDALIGLAGTLRAYREKREHLLRALSIDPSSIEAHAILAQVEAHLAAGEVLAPGGVQVREPERDMFAVAPPMEPNAQDQTETLYCYNHPKRETGLRCTSCDRPICSDCVRQAAVGQLCPDCARTRRPVNYQVSAGSLALSAVIALAYGLFVSVAAGFALGMIGFFGLYLAIIFGPMAGELLVRLLERVNRKRGRSVQIVVGICYGLGAAPLLLIFLIIGRFSIGLAIFTVAAIVTTVTRLR